MEGMRQKEAAKRSLSVNVKLSQDDMDLINQAAEALWPKAILTKSSIVLGLARIHARDILDQQEKRPKHPKQ